MRVFENGAPLTRGFGHIMGSWQSVLRHAPPFGSASPPMQVGGRGRGFGWGLNDIRIRLQQQHHRYLQRFCCFVIVTSVVQVVATTFHVRIGGKSPAPRTCFRSLASSRATIKQSSLGLARQRPQGQTIDLASNCLLSLGTRYRRLKQRFPKSCVMFRSTVALSDF